MKIVINAITTGGSPRTDPAPSDGKCKICGSVVASANRHDFRTCLCGAVSADGGRDYLKRCGNLENYSEESFVLLEDDDKDVGKVIQSSSFPTSSGRIYKYSDLKA